MKKGKEWLIKELLGHEIGDYGNYYNSGYEDGLAYALKLAHQLDEPEKIVIPQFVAEWWEQEGDSVTLYGGLRVKKKDKFDLISKLCDMWLDDHLLKVEDWIVENDSAFLDLVNGRPYEVEKEKLYYVINDAQQLVLVNIGHIVPSFTDFEIAERVGILKKYQLTEEEIKKYDARYWQFAVEVEE